MKITLIIATLLTAAVFSNAGVKDASAGSPQLSNDNGNGQELQVAVVGQGQRAQGRRGEGCGKQDGQRGADCKGKGKGQRQQKGKQKRQGKGQGQQKGKRGQCGGLSSALPAGGSAASATGTAQGIVPWLRYYADALQSTLEKELYARDYYLAADQALSGPPRFGNLAVAEQQHADAVGNLITYLGGTPVFSHSIPIVIPSTVAEADDTCKEIELLVISVYDRLIRTCPDATMLPTLTNIQAANYQHLSVVGG